MSSTYYEVTNNEALNLTRKALCGVVDVLQEQLLSSPEQPVFCPELVSVYKENLSAIRFAVCLCYKLLADQKLNEVRQILEETENDQHDG